jgi:hypothetical protein
MVDMRMARRKMTYRNIELYMLVASAAYVPGNRIHLSRLRDLIQSLYHRERLCAIKTYIFLRRLIKYGGFMPKAKPSLHKRNRIMPHLQTGIA